MDNIPIKIATGILIVAVLALAIAPAPVYAGGGGIFGIIASIVIGVLCYGVCLPAVGLALGLSAATITTLSTISVITTFASIAGQSIITGLGGGCNGSYNPFFGTCTRTDKYIQKIYNPSNIRFTGIDIGIIPTPESFAENPNMGVNVAIHWDAEVPPGIHEFLRVYDQTNGALLYSGERNGVSCRRTDMRTDTLQLPFSRSYRAEIRFDSCIQIAGGKRTRHIKLFCQDDGHTCGDFKYRGLDNTSGLLAETTFKTSNLPPVAVDIKADVKNGFTFSPGVPMILSWSSQYAASCSAEGSWSGSKPTSGRETVIPVTGNEVYTIVCTRPDGSTAQNSLSAEVPVPGIKIASSSSGSPPEKPFFKEVPP